MRVWQKGAVSANGKTTNCVGREKEKKDKMHTKKCANAERRAEARAVVRAELLQMPVQKPRAKRGILLY